ncbi:recombinase family protein [Bremerella sp.]|uniref:recombinase family protein n=1 Tax=Bremerella sp. TaxID=2795602 RepID=UPI00391D0830
MILRNHQGPSPEGERSQLVHSQWREEARKQGFPTDWLDPADSFETRVCKARENGFLIGTIYTRYSTKMQSSTEDQIHSCVAYAVKEKIYCSPELVFTDEGVKGNRVRRVGLERMKQALKERKADVLLVFRVSRLFRHQFHGFRLFQQDVVAKGLRAISVTQNIDTADKHTWKLLVQINGMADEMLLDATAAHVRAGLKGVFHNGYALGALPIGYRAKELPDAPTTKRGHLRTAPEVDPEVAELIRQHYQWIREGMTIQEGRRRWIEQGGPVDPRTPLKQISYQAYHRMLRRLMYTGRVTWGKTRSEFNDELDYVVQVPQPEDQIEAYHDEDLRIVSDELFFAVQEILAKAKKGPRGPRKAKVPKLWDLTTELFFCDQCGERFYVAGTDAQAMQCRQRTLCKNSSTVRRDQSVLAIAEVIGKVIRDEPRLIDEMFEAASGLHATAEGDFDAQLQAKKQAIQSAKRRVEGLLELVGEGTPEDQAETKARLKAERLRRSTLEQELVQLTRLRDQANREITREEIAKAMLSFPETLIKAAKGDLGQDAVRKAFYLLKLLTGGKIMVKCTRRHNRQAKVVQGTFELQLGAAIGVAIDHAMPGDGPTKTISIYLRKPPKLERIADRAKQLVIDEKRSYVEVAKILKQEGEKVNRRQVWAAVDRWYEMHGLPKPTLPYNNGHKRRPR